MSHKANYWLASLDPSRVKSGAFRVLFHLCDHHRDDRDPMVACFPSQETLRERTGLSNGALNDALATMEKDGLLIRRRSTAPGSSERRTYYILGCDLQGSAKQTPDFGVSPNSGPPETAVEQTPVLTRANSSFGPSKLRPTGEEPQRTTVRKEDPPLVPPAVITADQADPPDKPPPTARLPEGWALSDEGWAYARSQAIPDQVIEDEARGFHAYWTDRRDATARKSQRGWEQCWAGWCRRIAPRYRSGPGVSRQPQAGGRGQGGSLASIAARRRAGGEV